jgi:beta-lactam-binding protein with PASTA domain
VVVLKPRPEPILPEPSDASSQTPSGKLVPDVLGDPKNTAVRALEGAGYVVSVSQSYSASKASGIVIGQRPAGGSALDAGEAVAIVVSTSGQAAAEVKMPQIVGLGQAAAESKVKDAGLVPYITYGSSGVPNGQVISQWPLAGDSVPVGSEGFIQVQLNP